jgi:hypothetical protein
MSSSIARENPDYWSIRGIGKDFVLLQNAAHIPIAAVRHRFPRSVPQSRELEK